MQKDGQPPPAGVVARGKEWLVPVQRGWASKNDREAEGYLLASNQVAELGGWNEAALAEVLIDFAKAGEEALAGTGFDMADAQKAAEQFAPTGSSEDQDAIPPPAAAPWVKDGALYALGSHRLLVGDSLVLENRARLLGTEPVDLVLTDPPYAIYGSSSGISSSIADDKMVLPFFEALMRAIAEHLVEFGHLYAFTDWRSWATLVTAMKRVTGLELKNGLTWSKGGGLGANYMNTTEWVLFAHRIAPQKAMTANVRRGIRTVHDGNLLAFPRPTGDDRLHNAAKPVAMLERLLENSSEPGDRVWEPFSGSGSTLIACEKKGRACFAGEMDLVNAQITIERWERLTGQKHQEVK